MGTVPALSDTCEALLQAASDEFGEHGFSGTDTNKIARRAGFAPQTFYRWYRDKTAVFVAVYRRWEEDERKLLEELIQRGASARKLVDAIVEHHRGHRVFRRSLRLLSVQDEAVRGARAESRLRQIENIRRFRAGHGRPPFKPAELAVLLLQVERLADAIAERELLDMGLDEAAARSRLVELVHEL
jgi:AcrR family transcriptional regulator